MANKQWETTLWAYPWDVAGEGVEKFLDSIEASGVAGVSVATAYHSGLFVTPHHPKHRLYFPEGGALFFKPSSEATAKLSIKPRLSRLLNEGEPVRQLVEAAGKRGIKVRSWYICTHNTYLGYAYPDAVQRNVYGDPLYYALCPANPDVQNFIATLLSDLSHTHDIDGVDLEALSYLGFPHDFHHEKDLVGLDAESNFLLSVCFCPSCEARAKTTGIDVERVRSFIKDRLDAVFASEQALNRDDDGFYLFTGGPKDRLTDADVVSYMKMRIDVVMELFATVKERLRDGCTLRIIDWENPGRLWMRGFDERLNDFLDGIVMCCYSKDTSLLAELVEETKQFLPKVPVIAGIQAGYPTCTTAQDVVEQVEAARQAPTAGVQVYNYGLMRRENIGWLRDALQ